MLPGMLQPPQQRPVALVDEHLGPHGRSGLLSTAPAGLEGLLLAQHWPRQAIALGLLWRPCARGAAA